MKQNEAERRVDAESGYIKWRRIEFAPTDNGIPELDSLCDKYNTGEIDLCELVCRIWNIAK